MCSRKQHLVIKLYIPYIRGSQCCSAGPLLSFKSQYRAYMEAKFISVMPPGFESVCVNCRILLFHVSNIIKYKNCISACCLKRAVVLNKNLKTDLRAGFAGPLQDVLAALEWPAACRVVPACDWSSHVPFCMELTSVFFYPFAVQ